MMKCVYKEMGYLSYLEDDKDLGLKHFIKNVFSALYVARLISRRKESMILWNNSFSW